MKVIFLEDEHILNNNVKEYLELQGIDVESYVNGSELLENSNLEADIAILDIEVPGANGYEVIEWLKRTNEKMPVIFITAYTDISSIKKAYDLGCSDYLKKPFDLIELHLRIQQLVSNDDIVKLAPNIEFDMQNEQLYSDNKIQKLTKIQRSILKILIQNKNKIVTYDILIGEIWDNNFVKINTIASHVKDIRKLLPSEMIDSIRAEGYRLYI